MIISTKTAFSAAVALGCIISLLFYVAAVIGMQLFGGFLTVGNGLDPSLESYIIVPTFLNFDTFGNAMFSVWALMNNASWTLLLFAGIKSQGYLISVIYFILLKCAFDFVILNLLFSTVMANFSTGNPTGLSTSNMIQSIYDIAIDCSFGLVPAQELDSDNSDKRGNKETNDKSLEAQA